jgi:hypothetical protein
MDKDLSYINSDGHTVFTSHFLKNRGTCCRSFCLHCPFGLTIKKFGIEFEGITSANEFLIDQILQDSGKDFSDWKSFLPENVLLIKLKGTVCGFLLKNHIVIKHLFLKKHFQSQGISKELVEAYLF